jgi:hypothetical protein
MIFLSHKYEDKGIAINLDDYLKLNKIETWLDKDELQLGQTLSEVIPENIKACTFFVALISEAYVTSHWCLEEFRIAYENKKRMIIIFIEDRTLVKNKNNALVNMLSSSKLSADLDLYAKDKTWERVRAAVQVNWSSEVIHNAGREVFHIKIEHEKLTDDLLTRWSLDLKRLIADGKNDSQPIKPNMAVAISGAFPAWLVAYLVIPCYNKRDVYVYNYGSKSFIGVYETQAGSGFLGSVFPYIP